MNEIKRSVRSAKRLVNTELKHGNEPDFYVNIDTYELIDRSHHSRKNWKSNLHINSTYVRLMYRKNAFMKSEK